MKDTNKIINLWSEGYSATGNYSPVTFHGSFEAETLKEAIQAFKDTLTDPYSISCINVENETFWGCRFFDNEADARKSFG